MWIKYSLNISATSLSSVTSTSVFNRLIYEEALIFSENNGLIVFQNF